MGSCNSGDHIAGYHVHTDIIICNTGNHNSATALERSVIEYWALKMLYWIQTLSIASGVVLNQLICMKV